MSDPFASLTPQTGGGMSPSHVVRYQYDAILRSWMQYNLAYPQLYVIDRKSPIPAPIADDGQPLTEERIRELMRDIPPMYVPDPESPTGYRCSGVDYRQAFQDRIQPEPLGRSSIAYRPKYVRYVHPVEARLPSEDEP